MSPILSLSELQTAWLPRRMTQLAGMPGLNNDIGSLQVEADPAAVKHPVFPPYSAGNETTWVTLLGGKHVARQTENVEVRWTAYQVERRCRVRDFLFESTTSLLPEDPGCVIHLKITNASTAEATLDLGFLCSGRASNTGSEGYAWAVPTIPTDVFSFTREDGLGQNVDADVLPGGICIANEAVNAFSVQVFEPVPTSWKNERRPEWKSQLAPGETFEVKILGVFHADREVSLSTARKWAGRTDEAAAEAKCRWENLWEAAFTPGNKVFSGHLPTVETEEESIRKLYYNGVLTLVTCRRVYPQAVVNPAYLTLWPRRGEGSSYLAWELNCTSGILARLDPAALRAHWLLLASAPWLDYQVTNFFTGDHGGWGCCAQPQSLITAALNLSKWSGDVTWQQERLVRKPKKKEGFEAASQGQVVDGGPGESVELSGLDAFREAVLAHRTHRLAQRPLVNFGGRAAYLECITNYAHGTAGHTAIQSWGLREAAGLLDERVDEEAEELLDGVRSLYRLGEGYFDCEYPDGRRVPAPNLYDLSLVLRHVGHRLPESMVEEIVRFIQEELLTPTWSHCLWPSDLDALSTTRCDHQWSGCFSGWIPQFILGIAESGASAPWLLDWIRGVAKTVRQGPFAQAYWAEDVYPAEAGAAAKCFDELTQGNHWVIGSGVLFAEMVLDGLGGLQADLDGKLGVRASPLNGRVSLSIKNIRIQGRDWNLIEGELRAVTIAHNSQ